MGIVFQAEDQVLGRPVALKVMQPSAADDLVSRARFLREAKAVAAVEHDHIVTIHHVGEDGGVPFIAMPLLQGESLEARLDREGRLPVADVLRIGREVALGLGAAHQKGLIHRDIKPANIWLEGESGRVKLLDFGLARPTGGSAHLTQRGFVVGTPHYMSPEQSRGLPLDARADLFSLGSVLYVMATGRLPFEGEEMFQVLTALALDVPPPPQSLNPALPEGLGDLIMCLMSRSPEGRPESAAAVVAAIRSLEQRGAQAAVPPRGSAVAPQDPPVTDTPATSQGGPTGRRRRKWLRAAAVAWLIGTAGTWIVGRMAGLAREDGTSRQGDADRLAQGTEGRSSTVRGQGVPGPDAGGDQQADELRALWRRRRGTSAGVQTAQELRRLPSPLDHLDPKTVTCARAGLEGLVAVLQGHEGQAGPVAFSPDGRTLACGGGEQDQTVSLWNLAGPTPRRWFRSAPLGSAVSMVAFSPDGHTLAASLWDGTVHRWDIESSKARAAVPLHKPQTRFTCVAYAADGRHLAAGTDRGAVWLWRLEQSPPVEEELRTEGLGFVSGVDFSPEGAILAAAGIGVRLWDISTPGRSPRSLAQQGQEEWRGVSFSADGSLLATGCETGNIRLWRRADDFRPGPLFQRHTDQVWSIVSAPDGRTLASGGWDGRVVLWDGGTGARLREWLLAGDHINRVSFASDSRHLAFSAGDSVFVLRLAGPGHP
jgi:WD40 repeat protein